MSYLGASHPGKLFVELQRSYRSLCIPGENVDHGVSSLLWLGLAPLEHLGSVVQENSAKEPVDERKVGAY